MKKRYLIEAECEDDETRMVVYTQAAEGKKTIEMRVEVDPATGSITVTTVGTFRHVPVAVPLAGNALKILMLDFKMIDGVFTTTSRE